MLAKDQQGVSGFNAEELPGLLGNHDLTPVTHLCGAEYPLLLALTKNVFAASQWLPPGKSHFSYFSHGRIIQNSAAVVKTAAEHNFVLIC